MHDFLRDAWEPLALWERGLGYVRTDMQMTIKCSLLSILQINIMIAIFAIQLMSLYSNLDGVMAWVLFAARGKHISRTYFPEYKQ